MLIRLSIKNFALIDDLEMDFHEGLNVLTGETGAGKSIIIDAIGIIVGERASYEYIRSGETTCEVEALFEYKSAEIDKLLIEYGLESKDDIIIINRQLTDKGRSFNRINGRSVPVFVLKEIGKHLVDIHGQHQHHSILDSSNHILLLDLMGDDDLHLAKSEMSTAYEDYRAIVKSKELLKQESKDLGHERERLLYEIEEIEGASLKVGEDSSLEEKRKTLENAEKIIQALNMGYMTMFEAYDSPSIVDSLGRIVNTFEGIREYFKPIEPSIKLLTNVLFELEDLAMELRNQRDAIDFDLMELDQIHGRLELLNRLKGKYAKDIEELIKYKDDAIDRLDIAKNVESEMKRLKETLEQQEDILRDKAITLHIARRATADRLEKDIFSEMKDLDMKDIVFSVSLNFDEQPDGVWIDDKAVKVHEYGVDNVEFLISTNPGEPLKPLIKIVSGGETSRIMLALKSIMAKVDGIPCLIFDEVDAGVGGRAAHIVGEKLSKIAKSRQVLCITHSPQIACQGDVHFKIKKDVFREKTYTKVTKLTGSKRVDEIARMLGGNEITENTIAHAKEMLHLADINRQ